MKSKPSTIAAFLLLGSLGCMTGTDETSSDPTCAMCDKQSPDDQEETEYGIVYGTIRDASQDTLVPKGTPIEFYRKGIDPEVGPLITNGELTRAGYVARLPIGESYFRIAIGEEWVEARLYAVSNGPAKYDFDLIAHDDSTHSLVPR